MDLAEQLNKFHKQSNKIRKNKDFFCGVSCNFKVVKNDSSSVVWKGPDEKTIKAFLLDIRPFFLKEETVFVPFFCNQLKRFVKENDLKNNIEKLQVSWNKFLNNKGSGIVFNIESKELKNEEVIDLWLNGEYFHPNDKKGKKAEFLNSVKIVPFEQMFFNSFINLMQTCGKLILWLDDNVVLKCIELYDKK